MTSLEESIKLLVEENRKFSAELREFKEENRLGFEELRKSQQKTEEENRKLAEENHAGFEELRKSQRKTESLFNTQWSRLVEALVNNQVVLLFQSRGIPVQQTSERVKGCKNGRNFEFDILVKNGDALVVIEVKTTLRVDDVKEFLDELDHFKEYLPEYSDLKVYGAVAFLHEASKAALYAAKSGLFTILATGSSAVITNPLEFQPQEY